MVLRNFLRQGDLGYGAEPREFELQNQRQLLMCVGG